MSWAGLPEEGGSFVTICTVCGSPESLPQRKALLRELFGKELVEMRIGNLEVGPPKKS